LNTGALTLNSTSSFVALIDGPTAFSQDNVTGTVNLAGAPLSVTLAAVPTAGENFTLINNDSNDPVVGTFADLAPGTHVAIGGIGFQILYNGGSNSNDVVLVANSSPQLSGSVILPTLFAGAADPSGVLISALLASGLTFTDADAGALQGIAVVGADNTQGTWQYTTDGTNWNPFASPTEANARLLASDATTRIRFVPNDGFSGTVPTGLTFHAWDQSAGTNGGTADATLDGNSTPFSAGTATASITVDLAPTVIGVYVSGSAWTTDYEDFLDSSHLGAVAVTLAASGNGAIEQGYSIPSGMAQYDSLAWSNLDTLRIAFSKDVTITASTALTLLGANAEPAIAMFTYDSTHFVATWTFTSALGLNANLIDLDNTQVKDAAGATLDGSWTDQSTTFADQGGTGSGNGAPGSDFDFGFYTLPGDVQNKGTVLSGSAIHVRNALGTSIGDPLYTYRDDVKGLGQILSAAFITVRNDLGTSTDMLFPPSPPPSHAVSGSPGSEDAPSLDSSPATVSADMTSLAVAASSAPTPAAVTSQAITSATTTSETTTSESTTSDPAEQDTVIFVGAADDPAGSIASLPASSSPWLAWAATNQASAPSAAWAPLPASGVLVPEATAEAFADESFDPLTEWLTGDTAWSGCVEETVNG
jgi:hypothetical protein